MHATEAGVTVAPAPSTGAETLPTATIVAGVAVEDADRLGWTTRATPATVTGATVTWPATVGSGMVGSVLVTWDAETTEPVDSDGAGIEAMAATCDGAIDAPVPARIVGRGTADVAAT